MTFMSPGIATSINMHVPCCHGLWCPVYCSGWFCRCALVNSVKWLPYLSYSFLLALTEAHTSVHCLILPPFPRTCCSAVRVCLCVSPSVAHTGQADILWSTASSDCRQSVSVLSFCLQCFSHHILLSTPHLVLLYINFTFSLSSQISPRQPQQRVVFTNKLSIHTSYLTHRPCVNLLSRFSFKDSPNFPSPSSSLSPFSFAHLILLLTLLLS